jgi:hypothetical protein
MPRVLLLEIVPVDRLQRPISFPFLQGALKTAGAPVRRVRFAVPASARAQSGTSGFVFGPEEEESLRKSLADFRPTHVIIGPEPSPSLLKVLEAADPRPEISPFALQIAEGQIPLVPLRSRAAVQGVEWFEQFLGVALRRPGEEHLNIYELAAPDFEWEPGNKAAEEAWSLPYLVTGEACAYHKGLGRNPVFKDVDTSGAARLDGCTFCVRPAVEESWSHEPADLMGRQLEALARTHRKQSGRLAVRILGDAFLLNVEAFAKTVKGLALPPCDFLLDGRSDVLVAQRPALENALREMAGLQHTLNISLVGVENFDPDELVRMNKGASWKINLELIRTLLELENRYPTRFLVRRHSPLSLILFTPWTRLEDLALNVVILREGHIESLFNKIFTSRMRLYRTLPIHALAARDGLIALGYSDPLFDTARENFYSDEIPWRFRDRRVEAVNSLFLRLTDRPGRARDQLGQAIDKLQLTDRLAFAEAVIDAALQSVEPAPAFELIEKARALQPTRTRTAHPLMAEPELWERLAVIRRASDAAPKAPAPHVTRETSRAVGEEAIALATLLRANFSSETSWTLGDFRLESIDPGREDEVIFRFGSTAGPLRLHVSPLKPGRGAYLKAGAFAISHAKETPIDTTAKDSVARRLGSALEPIRLAGS